MSSDSHVVILIELNRCFSPRDELSACSGDFLFFNQRRDIISIFRFGSLCTLSAPGAPVSRTNVHNPRAVSLCIYITCYQPHLTVICTYRKGKQRERTGMDWIKLTTELAKLNIRLGNVKPEDWTAINKHADMWHTIVETELSDILTYWSKSVQWD